VLALFPSAGVQETTMANKHSQPQTFVEKVLAFLEGRFPWLGKDLRASSAGTVDQPSRLHDMLRKASRATRSGKKRGKT
jgi:hypothetical protein